MKKVNYFLLSITILLSIFYIEIIEQTSVLQNGAYDCLNRMEQSYNTKMQSLQRTTSQSKKILRSNYNKLTKQCYSEINTKFDIIKTFVDSDVLAIKDKILNDVDLLVNYFRSDIKLKTTQNRFKIYDDVKNLEEFRQKYISFESNNFSLIDELFSLKKEFKKQYYVFILTVSVLFIIIFARERRNDYLHSAKNDYLKDNNYENLLKKINETIQRFDVTVKEKKYVNEIINKVLDLINFQIQQFKNENKKYENEITFLKKNINRFELDEETFKDQKKKLASNFDKINLKKELIDYFGDYKNISLDEVFESEMIICNREAFFNINEIVYNLIESIKKHKNNLNITMKYNSEIIHNSIILNFNIDFDQTFSESELDELIDQIDLYQDVSRIKTILNTTFSDIIIKNEIKKESDKTRVCFFSMFFEKNKDLQKNNSIDNKMRFDKKLPRPLI